MTTAYVEVSSRPSDGQAFYDLLNKPENLGAIPNVQVKLVNRLPTLDFLKGRVDIVIGEGRMGYAEKGVLANGSIPSIDTLGDDPVRTLRETLEILLS